MRDTKIFNLSRNMSKFVASQVVSLMKNEQRSQSFMFKVPALYFSQRMFLLRDKLITQGEKRISPPLSLGQTVRQVVASGRYSTCVDLGANLISIKVSASHRELTQVDLCANLISIKVSASHRKSTQVNASSGQTKSQVDPSLQLASTCVSVWPGLYCAHIHMPRQASSAG